MPLLSSSLAQVFQVVGTCMLSSLTAVRDPKIRFRADPGGGAAAVRNPRRRPAHGRGTRRSSVTCASRAPGPRCRTGGSHARSCDSQSDEQIARDTALDSGSPAGSAAAAATSSAPSEQAQALASREPRRRRGQHRRRSRSGRKSERTPCAPGSAQGRAPSSSRPSPISNRSAPSSHCLSVTHPSGFPWSVGVFVARAFQLYGTDDGGAASRESSSPEYRPTADRSASYAL